MAVGGSPGREPAPVEGAPVTAGFASSEATVPPPGPHGDDAARVGRALGFAVSDVLDLATSLNPVAPRLDRLLTAALSELRRYPDVQAATALLASAIGVPAEQVLLTNGGAEAIALVAGELGEGEVVEPEFSLYRRHLRTVVAGARGGDPTRTTRRACSPVSQRPPPSGTRLSTPSPPARGPGVTSTRGPRSSAR